MVDNLSPEKRSLCMSNIKGKNTKLEFIVRKALHKLGYRYRIHLHDLPGIPDIVFTKRKKAIFIHGCYWHRHHCKRGQSLPKTNKEFWQNKFNKTQATDLKNLTLLKNSGWKVLILWECEIKKSEYWLKKLKNFIDKS